MRGKVDNSRGDARGQRDRDLREEDRPPVERLGQCAAERRPRREAEDRGGVPRAAARAATVDELEDRDQHHRRPTRLQCAEDQQNLQRAGQAAAQRRGREEPAAGRSEHRCGDAQARDERQRDREHQRVDAQHRRGAFDRGVELVDDRRQRERDDRRIGERERGSEEEQGAADAHMLAISRAQPRTRRLKWRHATRARPGTAR
jgi:hypothetical protein